MKTSTKNGLAVLGERLSKIDRRIIVLVGKRKRAAVEIAFYKKRIGRPLLRRKIEMQRRAKWIRWGSEEGLDPEDARTLFNVILAQMCRIEIAALQSGK
jgi:chorismate mutase